MKNDAAAQATLTQHQAADPMASVALRASAGSGKTKVLVDRFLRLCMEDTPARAHPRSILAITFTKKAAMEIQERLLESARELALADADELRCILEELFGRKAIKDTEMAHAAGLYELILEDLSGLNVGTIHSFCQLILSRFAAEAGLDPHFTVLDDNTDLVDEALDLLEEEISSKEDLGRAAQLLDKDPAGVRRLLQETEKQSMRLSRWLSSKVSCEPDGPMLPAWNRKELLPHLLEDLRAFLFPDLPVEKEVTVLEFLPLLDAALERFLNEGLDQVEQDMGADLQAPMVKVTKKLKDKGLPLLGELKAMIAEYAQTDPEDPNGLARTRRASELVSRIRLIFLTTTGNTRKHSGVKNGGLGEVYNTYVCEQSLGMLTLLHMVNLLELYYLNAALLKLMLRLMDIVDQLKRRDRVIDFQDLEDMACRLLADEGRALSLLHRLDDSLNHILLDEFQDTNFNQWDMIDPFVSEFLSKDHDGARKTVFVVGDVKQSIYSFRAAEPELFAKVEKRLQKLTLPTNFRSLPGVVGSVGCVFNQPPLKGFYSEQESQSAKQACFRDDGQGLTVLIKPYASDEDEFRSADQLAADAAARLVRQLVDGKVQTRHGTGPEKRDLNWGDILVLCRTRTEIGVYEKAFRQFNIPVMPAGRGMLAASREIQDVLALLRWLVYPADDVALATVLRSPIFRFSEAKFQKILAKRELHRLNSDGKRIPPFGLWSTLLKLKDDPEFGCTSGQLRKWRDHLGRENSHDFLRRIFREGRLLEKYQASGEDQVRHNLTRLFDLALGTEVAATPTVRHLSDVIERAARRGTEEEAVMPEESGRGRVNFMTIHGAKGLQSPVVLLVDADRKKLRRGGLLRLPKRGSAEPLLFKVKNSHIDGIELKYVGDVDWENHELKAVGHEARHRDDVESANLLYVAMTRAEDQLFVLGADKARGDNHVSMMSQVRDAAEAGQCELISQDDPPGLTRPPEAQGNHAGDGAFAQQPIPATEFDSTGETLWTPPTLAVRYKVETPSTIESADRITGSDTKQSRRAAMERGNQVHLLLQLAADGGVFPPGHGEEHDEAAAVFANPAFDWVFYPERHGGRGLSEAAVIHRRVEKSEVRITGSIDRLIIRDNIIDIIDYKTNRTGGDEAKLSELCEHYRPQLESYSKVMAAMHANTKIRTWLLFTDPNLVDEKGAAGRLMEVQ